MAKSEVSTGCGGKYEFEGLENYYTNGLGLSLGCHKGALSFSGCGAAEIMVRANSTDITLSEEVAAGLGEACRNCTWVDNRDPALTEGELSIVRAALAMRDAVKLQEE
jgi:hypothetical protein